MSGFITESVSKISDGFGSTLKMLAFMGLTTLTVIPIRTWFGLTGVIVLLILLLLLAVFYFFRSLRHQLEKSQKAWCGMAAGVLLWQVTRYLPEVTGMGWLDEIGILYWLGLACLTGILWRKVLPTSVKFTLLTFLLNWIGHLYLIWMRNPLTQLSLITTLVPYIRYLGILGVPVVIWWMVTRSRSSMQRRYAGLILYFCVLLSLLAF